MTEQYSIVYIYIPQLLYPFIHQWTILSLTNFFNMNVSRDFSLPPPTLILGLTASLLRILNLVKLMSAGILPAYTLVAVSILVLR